MMEMDDMDVRVTCPKCGEDLAVEAVLTSDDDRLLCVGEGVRAPRERPDWSCRCALTADEEAAAWSEATGYLTIGRM